jgi:hypothetical protein
MKMTSKTTFSKTTLMVLALGIFSASAGFVAAQETTAGAVSGQELAATTHNEAADNGALPGRTTARCGWLRTRRWSFRCWRCGARGRRLRR